MLMGLAPQVLPERQRSSVGAALTRAAPQPCRVIVPGATVRPTEGDA